MLPSHRGTPGYAGYASPCDGAWRELHHPVRRSVPDDWLLRAQVAHGGSNFPQACQDRSCLKLLQTSTHRHQHIQSPGSHELEAKCDHVLLPKSAQLLPLAWNVSTRAIRHIGRPNLFTTEKKVSTASALVEAEFLATASITVTAKFFSQIGGARGGRGDGSGLGSLVRCRLLCVLPYTGVSSHCALVQSCRHDEELTCRMATAIL